MGGVPARVAAGEYVQGPGGKFEGSRSTGGKGEGKGGGKDAGKKDEHDDPNAYTNGSVSDLRQGDWVQPETSGDTHDPKQLDSYRATGNVREGQNMAVTLTFKDGTKVETRRGDPVRYYRPPDSKYTANGGQKLGT